MKYRLTIIDGSGRTYATAVSDSLDFLAEISDLMHTRARPSLLEEQDLDGRWFKMTDAWANPREVAYVE